MHNNMQYFFLLFLFFNLILIYPTSGQALGNGVSKHTWAASDPRACYDWFFKFIPVTEEAASCDDGICECATQVGGKTCNRDQICFFAGKSKVGWVHWQTGESPASE